MKNKPLIMLYLLCTVALSLNSCHSTPAEDKRPNLVKAKLISRLADESQGCFGIWSFTKTNGIEQNLGGAQTYQMEFNCTLTINKNCWKVGNGVTGFFKDFHTDLTYPTYDELAFGEAQQFKVGTVINLRGKADLVKKDNGWEVREIRVY